MKYLIVIEPTNTGFSAYSPDLPGCASTGRTRGLRKEHARSDRISSRWFARGWRANSAAGKFGGVCGGFVTAAHQLISEWSKWRPIEPPYIFPGDEDAIRSLKQDRSCTFTSWEKYYQDERFGEPDDTRLHLGLLPHPFAGNLNTAKIFVLMLNPGWHRMTISRKRNAILRMLFFRILLTAMSTVLCFLIHGSRGAKDSLIGIGSSQHSSASWLRDYPVASVKRELACEMHLQPLNSFHIIRRGLKDRAVMPGCIPSSLLGATFRTCW